MGIRQTMNENPGVSVGVTAAVILLVIGVIVWELLPQRNTAGSQVNQAFYSIDDGKTWFADDANKLPPFMHDGKPAVRAVVFRCGSGQPFVARLERYTEEGKKMAAEVLKSRGRTNTASLLEVKKPGQRIWVPFSAGGAQGKAWTDIMTVTCPDGGSPTPVYPGQK